MRSKHFIVLYALIIVLIVALIIYRDRLHDENEAKRALASFEDCIAAGNPVQESYPRRCLADGKTFTETVVGTISAPAEPKPEPVDTHADLIRVTVPVPGAVANSPLLITGEARGSWFFEASFPVRLEDSNGKIIASGIAQAQGDWMTSDFVPFSAKLTFVKPATSEGRLVLQKDNPSGLPEKDDSLSVPLRFE